MASARQVSRTPAIRWDRVGRCALLAVFAGIVLLSLGPARSLLAAWGQSKARTGEVRALRREHDRLEARRRALERPGVMEQEARRLGYVRPGERAYVIRGLPK